MANSVKKNTVFVSIGQFTQMALSFILVPFAARYLGEEGFGQYSLATAIMYVIFLVNDFGLNTYTIRENSRDREKAPYLFGNALFVKLVFVIACAVALPIILFFYELPPAAIYSVCIFAVYGVLTSLGQLATGVFRAFERMEFETVVVILEKAIITGLGVWWLVMGADLIVFSIVFVIGGLATVGVSLWMIHRKFFPVRLHVDFAMAKMLVRNAAILGFSMFLVTIYDRVAVLLLGALQSAESVGWYSAAYRLVALTNIVPMIIVTATFPRLSRESKMNKEIVSSLFTKGFKYLLFLALPLIAGVIILAEPIIHLVYGVNFDEAVPALKILVLTSALNFINIFLAGLFWATNHQKRLFYFQATALLLNVILNVLLIPQYGHIGSAWASVATETIVLGLSLGFTLSRICPLENSKFILKGIGATTIMTLFLVYVNFAHVLVSIALSVIVYFTCLFLLRGIAIDEILSFRQRSV